MMPTAATGVVGRDQNSMMDRTDDENAPMWHAHVGRFSFVGRPTHGGPRSRQHRAHSTHSMHRARPTNRYAGGGSIL